MDPWVRYSVMVYVGLLLSGTLAARPVEGPPAELPAVRVEVLHPVPESPPSEAWWVREQREAPEAAALPESAGPVRYGP